MKPRYAIVRVDKECPSHYENINNDFVCADIPEHYVKHCKNCRYGDTKEQLIRKVAQVLRTKRALFGIIDKQLAKEIVEFLGVEK